MTDTNNLSSNSKKILNEIRKEILFNRNYKHATEIISDFPAPDNYCFKDTLGMLYFQTREYEKAKVVYKNLNMHYQEGFCELLCGNEQRAAEIWNTCPDSPAVQWGLCVLDFIKLKVSHLPTFLQVRNFLEHDLERFLQANRLEYAENLVNCCEILADINLEAYKFIGRALYNNGYRELAAEHFTLSRDAIPNDPEVHYYLAQCNYLNDKYDDAVKCLNRCLELNTNYTPARVMLDKISKKAPC